MNKFIVCILLLFCCACSDVNLMVPNEVKKVQSYNKGEMCVYHLYDGANLGFDTIAAPCGWANVNDIVVMENNQIVVKRR